MQNDLKDILTPQAMQRLGPAVIDRLTCLLFHPQYDPGPDCAWEKLFSSAPLNHYISFPQSPFHTHFGPVFYRGRLDGSARVLVIGQDPSTDEVLAQRVFVGQAGQCAQNFLSKIGVTHSYVMFNSFLFGGQSGSLSSGLVTDPTIMAYRNRLFDHVKATNNLQAVIAFGALANTSALNWPGLGNIPLIHLTHPTAQSGVAANWNSHLVTAHNTIPPDAGAQVNTTAYNAAVTVPGTDVPRRDLPFGIPPWHGAGGGTRSQRGSGANFETQIIWTAP
jgi:uracil-DNA glycosylase